jgi:O-acetyl-ADP-ribose deacetylase (regulator of RNase III)
MPYVLHSSSPPSPADLVAYDYENLAEFVDDLTELVDDLSVLLATTPFAETSPAALSLDFCRLPKLTHLPFSIPEAFREAVAVVEAAECDLSVSCFFDSERTISGVEAVVPGSASADRSATIGNIKVVVRVGGITRVVADAIVNASNTRLVLGGGVSYAIKRASKNSNALQNAMAALAPIGPGDVVVTPSFGIDTTPLILHAATAGGAAEVIRRAYERCFDVAEQHRLEVIGIPALGTGTGGLEMELCANIFASVLRARPAAAHPRVVVVVLYNDIAAADLFAAAVGAS